MFSRLLAYFSSFLIMLSIMSNFLQYDNSKLTLLAKCSLEDFVHKPLPPFIKLFQQKIAVKLILVS